MCAANGSWRAAGRSDAKIPGEDWGGDVFGDIRHGSGRSGRCRSRASGSRRTGSRRGRSAAAGASARFFRTRTGNRVFDFLTAGGYYSEPMARAVGPDGFVMAHNPPGLAGQSRVASLSRVQAGVPVSGESFPMRSNGVRPLLLRAPGSAPPSSSATIAPAWS